MGLAQCVAACWDANLKGLLDSFNKMRSLPLQVGICALEESCSSPCTTESV